jgi:UPF0176 protein
MYTIAALYRFVGVPDVPAAVAQLKGELRALGLRGILLVAPEGINGTLIGLPEAIEGLLDILGQRYGLPREDVKFAHSEVWTFNRLRVRVKKEIITFKQPEADPTKRVGTYASPAEWNALLNDPDVLVLDTRNTYETEIGTFEGAVVPPIRFFTEFADYVRQNLQEAKKKKIAMFCTGGIRCEKASAFMLAEGFEQVYHLKGGILKYIQDTPPEQSHWNGKCFVFDHRVGVDRESLT